MMNLKKIYYAIFVMVLSACSVPTHYDIVVAGGGTSGTCAAIQSARLGAHTLLVESSPWLGGMLTSAGVSAVDGNYNLPSGLWGEFKDALSVHYGSIEALKTAWVSNVMFEPSIGNDIFQKWVAAQSTLKCSFQSSISKIERTSKGWNVTIEKNGRSKRVSTSLLIDATDLGDIAKAAQLPYHVGMDAASETGESQAPLLANHIVQDMTYAMTLQKYDTPQLIRKPEGYNPLEFRNCCINRYNDSTAMQKPWSAEKMLSYGKLPNEKYMINWPMDGNDIYLDDVEYTQLQRDSLHAIAKAKSIRFLYFMQHELGLTHLGLAREYPSPDGLPFIPYYREGRRFKGVVQFTLNDILTPYNRPLPLYRTDIAVGDYPVDHHHNQYRKGDLPDIKFPSIPSYGLPLGVIIPQKEDALLLAEKAVSVSNLANGTTRLQPVAMQIGQAAGALAALAIKQQCAPRLVPVHQVQRVLLNAGCYLLPFLDVDKKDPCFLPLQRIGVMGILRGEGRHVGWANQTWLRADSVLMRSDLVDLSSVYRHWKIEGVYLHEQVSLKELLDIITQIAASEKIVLPTDMLGTVRQLFADYRLGNVSIDGNVKRKQMAVLIDRLLNPFDSKEVNLLGELK